METEQKKRIHAYSISSFIMSLYLFFMLGVFPLYFRYQYYKMGDWKYKLFQYTSIACVLILFFFYAFVFLLRLENGRWQETKAVLLRNISILDKMVLLYFFSTTLSFLLSDFKKEGFFGSYGWYMGYLSQILFVAVYVLVSRGWKFQHIFIGLLMITSAFVYIVAIFHRFDVDIIGVYGNLSLKYKIEFLSTMGQSSWYSSFLCTVFPLGLYLFFTADKKWLRFLMGIYSVLSMLTLVTQNTDSAFLCLAVVILFLFYLALDGKKQMLRFLEVLILVSGSFTFMGILQRLFADRMIPLDHLSVFMSQGWISPVALGVLLIVYGCNLWKKANAVVMTENTGEAIGLSRELFWNITVGAGIGIFLLVILIILNSTGFLYSHFGYQNMDNYLFFSDDWGNRRGFAWRFTCEAYGGLPWLQKLFGVGPDCYSAYNESIPKLAQQIKDYWGNLALTNAHNEYLTKLYNLGILGLLSYVGMLGSAVILFIKKRREHILLPAFALCVVSYMIHLIFCYEQVCCTPIFYILMGFGSNLIYKNARKSTY